MKMKKNNRYISLAFQWLYEKGWPYVVLITILYFLFYKKLLTFSPFISITIGLIPILIILVLLMVKNSRNAFYFLFALQFLVIIPTDFLLEYRLGIITSVMCIIITLLLIIYYSLYDKFIDWKLCNNTMLWSILCWSAYCCLELANPNCVPEAWSVLIFQYAIYPLLCTILVPITIKDIKGIYLLLIIWSIFVLICVVIAFRQQHFGWNAKENYFLFTLGGASTHIIWSGIRYFSCFTDAANFGVHMAMAATTFGISTIYIKNKVFKSYCFIIMILAFYGMFISGTRSAIAIPFGGLLMLVILSKSIKGSITTILLLFILYLSFSFTHIGDSNSYIHKMRSAFHPSNDPSYLVRVENRKRMKDLVIKKPFGYGIGLSKSDIYKPKERMPYPPDSFLISIWVETGYIGLIFFLAIHGFIFVWASWLLLFKVKNKRIRGLTAAWLGMAAGFFIAAYANDVMQYPNCIVIYTGIALAFAAPYIDKSERKNHQEEVSILSTKE
ncbi:MAG: O-antigen ligase family protein [Bacteroidales bacterium]|nr:O-antigen ligase family protein [Bacteroidales bacterium]